MGKRYFIANLKCAFTICGTQKLREDRTLIDSSIVFYTVLSGASQMGSRGHSMHSGLRAWHTFLPNQIT
jgi:hypothetical protein